MVGMAGHDARVCVALDSEARRAKGVVSARPSHTAPAHGVRTAPLASPRVQELEFQARLGNAPPAVAEQLQAQRERRDDLQSVLRHKAVATDLAWARSWRSASCTERCMASKLMTVLKRSCNGLVTKWPPGRAVDVARFSGACIRRARARACPRTLWRRPERLSTCSTREIWRETRLPVHASRR